MTTKPHLQVPRTFILVWSDFINTDLVGPTSFCFYHFLGIGPFFLPKQKQVQAEALVPSKKRIDLTMINNQD